MELIQYLLYFSLFTLTLYFLTTAKPRKPRLPPGPRGLPIIGNLLSLSGQPHRTLAQLAKLHGPILTIKFGLTTSVVLSSHEVVKEALRTKDQLLADRWIPDVATVLDYHKVSMIWLPTNELWKHLRTISATHLLSSKSLEASKQLRQQKANELVASIKKQAGRPVDIGHEVFETVFSFLTNVLFSLDMEDKQFSLEFRELVNNLNTELGKPNISDIIPVLRGLDLQGRRSFARRHLGKLLAMFDTIIDRRMSSVLAGTGVAGDFLDSLLQLHVESQLDRPTVKAFLLDLMGGGTHTTSITLEWAMAELLRNPTVMAKLNSELKQVSSDTVDESDIQKLPYLQAVMKEVLRMHPPGPFLLPHKAVKDVELGGYLVPEGTQILVNIWAMGRDENVWTDPEVFRPERFFEREMDVRGRDFELIPFGSGRRSCPGMLMALKILHLMLATMLHAFEWRLPDGMEAKDLEMKERAGNALAIAVPLRAVPLPRN